MNAQQKKIVKIVGISLGSLLLIGGVIALVIYKKRQGELSEEPSFNSPSSSGNSSSTNSSGTSTSQSYTRSEIEQMQAWLLKIAYMDFNYTIVNAIQSTGGIDGMMGTGFYTALNEAIKKGYVKSLSDLYNKTN